MSGPANGDTPAGASRLDRLLQLLEHVGTAPGVRLTAAQQIAIHVEGYCMAESASGEGEGTLSISTITPIINRLVKLALSSKSWDVRTVTATSLGQSVAAFARHSQGEDIIPPSLKAPSPDSLKDFCLRDLVEQYEPLVASLGAEFELDLSAMSTADRLRQQRGQLKRTLDFMDGISDLTSELIEDQDLMVTTEGEGSTGADTEEDLSSKSGAPAKELSARERAMLRRRSRNGAARVIPRKPAAKLEIPAQWTEVANKHLIVRTLLALRANMLNATWTVRHGALLAIKEICSSLEASLPLDLVPILVRETVALLALDRFNDFISDQTVAPCRETAAQLLALLFVNCRRGGEKMAGWRQWIWHQSLQLADGKWEGRWQVRHGGLLGLKYLATVDEEGLHHDQTIFDRLYAVASQGCAELEDEDVKCLGAEILSLLLSRGAERVPQGEIQTIAVTLLQDSESAALVPALRLLQDIIVRMVKLGPESVSQILFLLAHRLRHPSGSVRIRALGIMETLNAKMDVTATDGRQTILLLRMLVQCIILDEEPTVWTIAERVAKELLARLAPTPSPDLLAAYVALCSIVLTPRARPFERRHFVFPLGATRWETTCEPAPHEIGFRGADLMLRAGPEGDNVLAASRRTAAGLIATIGERWYDERVQRRIAQALVVTSDDPMVTYLGIKIFGPYAGVNLVDDTPPSSKTGGPDDIWCMRVALAAGTMSEDLLKRYLARECADPLRQDLASLISRSWQWGSSRSAFLLEPILSRESRMVALPTLSLALAKADRPLVKEEEEEEGKTKEQTEKEKETDDMMTLLGWHLIKIQKSPIVQIQEDLLRRALLLREEQWEGGLAQDLFIALARSHAEWLTRAFICHLVPLLSTNFDSLALFKRRLMLVIRDVFAVASETMSSFSALFIVPVLGRIADFDGPTREVASPLFGDLLRLVPLAPSPSLANGGGGEKEDPGQDPMLASRWKEAREFLSLFMSDTDQVRGSQKRAQAMPSYRVPVEIRAHIRPYQQAGINWLAFLRRYGLHGALCDDMGLGKTLQTIVVLASNHYERQVERERRWRGGDATAPHDGPSSTPVRPESPAISSCSPPPSLVICPASLLGHWKHEIETFAPSLGPPLLYAGNANERRSMWPRHREHTVVITSYETVRSDLASLASVSWDYIVLDEGHMIKNPRTKLTLAIKSLRGERRLLLSGTPIQNNVIELWSLFDFLMPGMLGVNEAAFMDRYGKAIMAVQPKMTATSSSSGSNGPGVKEFEEAERRLKALHKQVLPFILRRMKEDVLTDLPPKIIQDYECEPSALQRLLCRELERQIGGTLGEESEMGSLAPSGGADGGGGGHRSGEKGKHAFSALQSLRKVCVHPRLLESSEQLEQALKETGDSLTDLAVAPKLLMLKELLLECGIGSDDATSSMGGGGAGEESSSLVSISPDSVGHRVLLFAQHQSTLDLIEELVLKPYFSRTRHLRLDGSVDQRDRFAIAQRFNADLAIELLLLTTSVGGLGLNLTGADTVIFMEHDWNPMRDLQAMDRAHRLGQKRVVTVYRLIVRDTLEQQIMGLQGWKTRVAATIVQQQNLQGADHEKLASTGLLDLLSEEPTTKRAKSDATSKGLAKLGLSGSAIPLFPLGPDVDPPTDAALADYSALAEYSKAFDINSFLKSVNQ